MYRCKHEADPKRSAHELPIRIPAIKTNTPPATTWNAAARKGVVHETMTDEPLAKLLGDFEWVAR
jgi:hypothetical protein